MKHGFVKVAAASPELRVADPAYNAQKIIAVIKEQAKAGVEILVFPELSLCGYTCGDLLLQKTLLDGCLAALKEIASATEKLKMLVFVGLPVEAEGGRIYNCAAAIANGEVKGLVPKSNVPNYGEFYEARHFCPAPEEGAFVPLWGDEEAYYGNDIVFEQGEVCVACEICEDLWSPRSPSTELALTRANIIVNLSASNETVGKREYRKTLLSAQSGKCVCAYVYADAGVSESTTDLVFSGNHFIYENGKCLAEAKPFSKGICVAEIDVGFLQNERRKINTFHDQYGKDYCIKKADFLGDGDLTLRKISPTPFVPEEDLSERAELILNIQAHALARRLKTTHSKTAVIGVSGGLDSALALLVTARAFDLLKKDRTDILGYTMPCFGTTNETKNNSVQLMQAMGITSKTVNIAYTVNSHFKDIGHDPEKYNVVYENAQARYRTMVLMDVANETQGLVVGTGDLSELALGWCTFNGDHMSNYAVNCGVPKTLVKYLVRAEAKRLGGKTERVLESILGTEISPELLPPGKGGKIAQKTEDLIGKYEINDFYLYGFLRRGDDPPKALYLAERAFKGKYSREQLKTTLINFYKRFFSQQFKRNCVPDGVKVGSVCLSPRGDWRMPSDAEAALWLKEIENL
ncbi:MAG: NAD(+) synthase [Clostridia bacterium]|nr:NAD(+) synthase [Clostridia bacterium]